MIAAQSEELIFEQTGELAFKPTVYFRRTPSSKTAPPIVFEADIGYNEMRTNQRWGEDSEIIYTSTLRRFATWADGP